jgi:hypothetical protein
MAETEELFKAIKKIEGRIDSIDFTLEQVLACLPQDQLKAKIMPAFSSEKSRRVFSVLESPGSQSEIKQRLETNGIAISQPWLSQVLTKFIELGLVKIVDVRGRENIYAKTSLYKLLGISKELLQDAV